VTSRASQDVRGEGLSEVWAERTLPQGLIAAVRFFPLFPFSRLELTFLCRAQLMGTIQERLYPNKEITRSMIRSGHWESFIRSLEHELQMMQLKSRIVLRSSSRIPSAFPLLTNLLPFDRGRQHRVDIA
jgi:hypothetical protein